MTLRSSLLAIAVLVALAMATFPAQGGSADDPEISDPGGDQLIVDVVPIGEAGQFTSADITAGWITADATNMYFNIQIAGAGTTTTSTDYSWTFHVTAGATEVEMKITAGAEQPTFEAPVTAATLADGVFTLTVPRTAFGAATVLSGIHIESQGALVQAGVPFVADTAPDDGADAGLAYNVPPASGGGGGSTGTPGDADGDGLSDTFEDQYFDNATSPQTGSGDGDSDGLNNTQEQANHTDPTKSDTDGDGVKDGQEVTDGTDPTKVDTDGDGVSDGQEKADGTNPKDPNSKKPTSTTTSGGPTTSNTSSRTSTSGTTSSSTSKSVADKFSDNTDYLGISGGVFAVVLIVCLIGLFGRWGL